MYKTITLTLALLFFGITTISAQYTAGGSYKRYQEVTRVSYDTIWNERKIELPVGPAFAQRFAFGIVSVNSDYKDKMSKTSYFNRPEYGAPIGTGQMGGKGGFYMEYGMYDPVNLLNKKLIPQLDLALYYNADLGYMRYDLSYLEDYFQSGTIQQDLVEGFYGSKWFSGFGIGPMLTYNINKDKELYIDLLAQIKFSWSSSIYLYNYSYEYDPASGYNTDYTLEISSEESGFDSNYLLGLNLRKNSFFVGIQKNGGFSDTRYYTEYFSIDYNNYSTAYISSIDLSNFRFVTGFHF